MSYSNPAIYTSEHGEWLSALDFYKKDIEILETRLAEVANKNTSQTVLAGVEHFQNQFIIQKNNIDELRHSINEHVHHVGVDAEQHAGRIETSLIKEHNQMKEEFTSFEKVVKDLREEFNEYLSKWM
jgi:seryl-tRNA synthetase